ncbi:unnamed protein product [Cuscuta europaea]|uniref:GRF-type domain-containing protein n=1 Tax=Cuscuta europaea TaxID=41803 RepID=A0A9P1EJZ3_CUSEU|nr:unnamed protein product [Cuscuta europaea]
MPTNSGKSNSGSFSWGRSDETKSHNFVQCYHNIYSKPRIVKSGANIGRRFYGCALWPKVDCSFFQWVEEYHCMQEDDWKISEKESVIDRLIEEKKKLEEKIAKLKKKKLKMTAKIEELQTSVCKQGKGEKCAYICLIMSWVLFVVVVYGNSK